MQTFLDFLPVVAFFGTYWITKDFYIAITVIMIAVTIQVAATWILTRTVNKMLLASSILVILLGALSLVLKNDLIFMWKPTVLNWIFAAVFLGSQYIGDKPLVQRVLGSVAQEEIRLDPADWKQLNLMWVGFFLISGAANIFVAYSFDEATWVNFKLFGLLGMTFVFLLIQAYWISRRTLEHKLEGNPETPDKKLEADAE